MGGFILSKSLIQFSVDDPVLNAPDNHNGVITHLEPDILSVKSSISTAELAPGVYMLRLIEGDKTRTQKIKL